jgi:uncharacterized protein (DUF697 family)
MNTIDLLWQIFRARYSLNALRQSFSKKYRLALIGQEEEIERLRRYLGEQRPGSEADDGPLLSIPAPLEGETPPEALEKADAAIYHLGSQMPEADWLRRQAERIPVTVPCLWVREAPADDQPQPPADPTLPQVHRLDPPSASGQLARLALRSFPDLSMRLARDFSRLRLECARRMTARVAAQNAMIAAASSVTSTLPVWGQLISLMAVTGETLVITASQLRLCLLMGALYGRPVEFFDRVNELWPVVGSAFGWRALARELAGLVPVAGPALKASVAYVGTWFVGESSRLFYELGMRASDEHSRRLLQQARSEAQAAAADFMQKLREGLTETGEPWPDEPTDS